MVSIEVLLNNSVEEAKNISKAVKKVEPKCILIVTGELHSRSVRFIWQKVFPNTKILISCINFENEVERDSILPIQRTAARWAFANVARQVLLRILGLERMKNLHHSTSE